MPPFGVASLLAAGAYPNGHTSSCIPKLFPDPIHDRTPQPDKEQPHYNICADICQSIEGLAVTQEVDRIVAKGGECCEAAKDPDEYQALLIQV